jgi:hypothetical protein
VAVGDAGPGVAGRPLGLARPAQDHQGRQRQQEPEPGDDRPIVQPRLADLLLLPDLGGLRDGGLVVVLERFDKGQFAEQLRHHSGGGRLPGVERLGNPTMELPGRWQRLGSGHGARSAAYPNESTTRKRSSP